MLATALELMESIARVHNRAMNLIQHAARLQQADDRTPECASRPPEPHHPHRAQTMSGGGQTRSRARPGGAVGLSRQERRVLGLMSQGLSNRSIARELKLSEQTIKNYLSTAFRKLGVTSRTEAAFRFLQTGVPSPPPPDSQSCDRGTPAPVVPGARPSDEPRATRDAPNEQALSADASVHASHDTQE
ncbi:response regulator transcription factor [Streptomyces longwoodensis]|uniref:helix-turn-helix transcriptional regulator n=1 Tax=Streptomyces longwoodensis TaxID=68231 RepID=UPI0033D8B434